MVFTLVTFQGVRYSLFAYQTGGGGEGGYADFDSIDIAEEAPRKIPFGKKIELTRAGAVDKLRIGEAATFAVVDGGLGRVALKANGGFVSVSSSQTAALRAGPPGQAETFQWIETFDGELTLLSLESNRYLRMDETRGGQVFADSPGPRADGKDGVRLQWRPAQ